MQRKSILDAERDIAHLLTARDEIKARALPKDALAPRELAANEAQIRARVMQLWQTRLLRFTKLTVADEIENALSYYEATFLREIPKIYADLEHELGQHPVASFLRMGQWIGGDRDGNPNVQRADAGIRAAPAVRSGAAPLPDRGALPGRRAVAVGACWSSVTPAMQALADSSPDTNEHRLDEPYRRALTGMYSRLAATLKEFTGGDAARHAVPPQNPYLRAEEFLADLRTIEDSLLAHHGSALVQQRLHPLIRAVEVFGFHLATVDLRQSSDQHEAVVGRAAGDRAHRAALREAAEEPARRALLVQAAVGRAAAARDRRPTTRTHAQARLAIFETARRDARALRRAGDPPLHHQPHRDRQRPAGSAAAAKGSGPAARHAGRQGAWPT